MSKKDEIIQNYSEKYPGIGSYMECISRAYMNGLATGGLSKYLYLYILNCFIK